MKKRSQQQNPPYYAFTIKYSGIVLQLRTNVEIISNTQKDKGIALWDTGASGTLISEKIVNDLQLIPTGKQKIHTPSGESIVNTYMLDIILPNKIMVKDVPVCDSDIGKQGLDVLIGMNIIALGDMTITNYNNKTYFTYRMPSQGSVDYVMQSAIKGRHK